MPGPRLVFGVTAALLSAAAHADDLLAVYREARERDASYAAAQAGYDAGRERLAEGRALLLPNVTLTADTQINDRDLRFRGPADGFGAGGSTHYNSNDLNVVATQPLFRASSWITYKQAELQVSQAGAQLARAGQDLVLRTAQAYFDALLAEDDLALARAQKSAIAEQLDQAKRNFEVGSATITDSDDAQARYDLTQAQEIAAENTLEIRREALRQILDRVPETLARVREGFPLTPPQPDDVNAWVARAQEASPTVRIARDAVEIARREVQKGYAGHLPTLDAVAAYTDSAQGAGPFGGPGMDTTDRYLGLQLALPLFQGGLVVAQTREAAANYGKATHELEAARRDAVFAARQAFLGVINGRNQVQALRVALTSSGTSLDSSKLGREVGVRTQVDVLNAEQQLTATRRDLAQATYTYILSVLRLKAAAGALGEDDMAYVNQWLEAPPRP